MLLFVSVYFVMHGTRKLQHLHCGSAAPFVQQAGTSLEERAIEVSRDHECHDTDSEFAFNKASTLSISRARLGFYISSRPGPGTPLLSLPPPRNSARGWSIAKGCCHADPPNSILLAFRASSSQPRWPWTSCNIRDKRGLGRVKRFRAPSSRVVPSSVINYLFILIYESFPRRSLVRSNEKRSEERTIEFGQLI